MTEGGGFARLSTMKSTHAKKQAAKTATADRRFLPWKFSCWGVYLAESAKLKEFDACTKAVHNWSDEILHSFDYPYSNAFTEGCNNKTKVLKRVCFGLRNFEHFRNRILFCSTSA